MESYILIITSGVYVLPILLVKDHPGALRCVSQLRWSQQTQGLEV